MPSLSWRDGCMIGLRRCERAPDCARMRLLTSSMPPQCEGRGRVTIIITDDDVKRLLPMHDCIEAMRVAFRDFADGRAVNRPRMRYLAAHPDPERKYLANVHVGAVPTYGTACVRAGSQIIRPPSA